MLRESFAFIATELEENRDVQTVCTDWFYLLSRASGFYLFWKRICFLASGCFSSVFLSLFVNKLRTAKVVPIACLVAAVALSVYAGYHVWKIEPLTELAEKMLLLQVHYANYLMKITENFIIRSA